MKPSQNHSVQRPARRTLGAVRWIRSVTNVVFVLSAISALDSQARAEFSGAASVCNPCASVDFEPPPEIVLAERVAVAPVVKGACGDSVIRQMTTYFAQNGLEVINREQVVRRPAEQGDRQGVFVDQPKAPRIGRILAPAVMLVTREDRCDAEWSEYNRTEKRTATQSITRTETRSSGATQGKLRPARTIIWNAISETKATIQARQALAGPQVLDRTTLAITAKQQELAEGEPEDEALSNANIFKLVQAKIPVSIVLHRIKTASSCALDLSMEALSGPVESGVGEDVIVAMIEKDAICR